MAKVLIVEDDVSIQEMRGIIFERTDHILKSVYNGKQGLEALAEFNSDIVFLDEQMPVMRGDKFLSELTNNKQYEQYKSIPIIGISGTGFQDTTHLKEELIKPVSFDDIIRCIETYCK